MKKKAFTLAEILIVLVLFGMLAGIIFKTYTTISQVSFRIHQEKQVAKEALLLSQVLENLAQDHTIDYKKYKETNTHLQDAKGLVDILYLKDNNNNQIEIKSDCNTEISASEFLKFSKLEPQSLWEATNQDQWEKIKKSDCKLTMTKTTKAWENWNEHKEAEITLLDSSNFLMTKIQFRILPYIGIDEMKTEWEKWTTNILPPLAQPWFQISGILYSKFYHPHKRSNNIVLPLQLFFTLGGNLPSLYDSNETTDAPTA